MERPWGAKAMSFFKLSVPSWLSFLELPARSLRYRLLVALLGFATLFTATWAIASDYIYDTNGRLIVVTNDAGQRARYFYDEVGNVERIEHLTTADIAVFGFSPIRGAPGVAIKIRGHGFSATAAQNAVSFNGVAANVLSATGSELIATVPAAASTGPITVTVAGASASSPNDFIVDPTALPPEITSVNPLIAAVGQTVTVVGQHLNPLVTVVHFKQRQVAHLTITDNQLTFPIPANVGSGNVTVSTMYGKATSADTVLVTPTGINSQDVNAAKWPPVNGAPQAFSTSASKRYAAAFVNGEENDQLRAKFSSISVSQISYWLYDTDNLLLATGIVTPGAPIAALPRLPKTGLYLLLMKPVTQPASWNLAINRTEQTGLIVNAAPVNVSIGGPDWRSHLHFTVASGQNVGLGISDLVTSGGAAVPAGLYQPDGTMVASQMCLPSSDGCDFNIANSQSGTYRVILDAPDEQTVNFKATLSTDVVGTLQTDTPLGVSLTRRGQNGRLTFSATQGTTLTLQIAGQTTVPASKAVYYSVYKPDGSLLASTSAQPAAILNVPNLPVTGVYTVFVDPYIGATLSSNLTLRAVDVTDHPVDGSADNFVTTVPDQSVGLSFMATPGANVGVGISDLAFSAGSYLDIYIYSPTGALTKWGCSEDCGVDLPNLVAGRYLLVMRPGNAGQTMQFNATVSFDVAATLQRNTALGVALPHRGQNGRFSFSAVAGETLALSVSGQTTTPAGKTVFYQIIKPDGLGLISGGTSLSSTVLNVYNLPASGTYTVFVDSPYGAAMSLQMLLAQGVTGVETVDGTTHSYQTSVPGQNVYVTFNATQGQNLGFGLSALSVSNGTNVGVTAYAPNGSTVVSETCFVATSGCDLNLPSLVAGTYRLVITPQSNSQTMSFDTTLSSDVTGTLVKGSAMPASLTRRGQNGRLSFAGVSGEALRIQVTGQTTVPSGRQVNYLVYRPNGSLLTSFASAASNPLFTMPTLTTTGTYKIVVDPSSGETLAAQVLLENVP